MSDTPSGSDTIRQAQREFRDALGSFATGVTIATTSDAAGAPVGVTASSFNSVSVDPPLVLWSLAKNSLSREAFAGSGHFAVHVLTARQEALSNRFARSGEDKFAGVDWHAGELGSPVLTEHAALFECRTRHQYDGGDHIIMVGEVVSFDARDEAPLLFHGGRYAEHRPRLASGAHGERADSELATVVARAHAALSGERSGPVPDAALADHLTAAELADTKRVLRRIAELMGEPGTVPAPARARTRTDPKASIMTDPTSASSSHQDADALPKVALARRDAAAGGHQDAAPSGAGGGGGPGA